MKVQEQITITMDIKEWIYLVGFIRGICPDHHLWPQVVNNLNMEITHPDGSFI